MSKIKHLIRFLYEKLKYTKNSQKGTKMFSFYRDKTRCVVVGGNFAPIGEYSITDKQKSVKMSDSIHGG
jgi:hypothetical protein